MPLVSIITVNYNQPNVTVDFLRSIQLFTASIDVEVIVVDNAPQENWEELFTKAYSAVKHLLSPKNLGFAGGNNLGIRHASGQYFLLLNNDTEITEGFVQAMVQEMQQNSTIGLLSPLIKYFEDKNIIQYAGFTKMNYLTARNANIGAMERDSGQYDNDSRETGFCHGAAVMCRATDLKKAGMMDERYFLYYEELDWCEMFKRIDKKIWFTGSAVVYHKESISVGKESSIKAFFITRNRILFIRKNTDIVTTLLFFLYYTFIAMPKQLIVHYKEGRSELAKQVLRGWIWNLTHLSNSKSLGYTI